MKPLTFLFLFVSAITAYGQGMQKKPDSLENVVYTVVEKMAEFRGGEKKMEKYIQKELVYPSKARLEGRGGVSYIAFIVEKDGSLTDIHVIKGASGGSDLDEAALQVVRSMPKWKPGRQNGKKVRVTYYLPIRFIGV
jgi:protein TonB